MEHSINQRGSAPTENHQRSDHRQLSYSKAARQNIPPTHNLINKSHPSGNSVQQVVITQQSNLAQVSSVNQTGPPMPAPTGPNSGNQISVLQQNVQMSQPGQRFNPPFHQHQRPQHQHQQRQLLSHRTPQNAVPTTSGVVQAVQQNVGPSNMSHPQHQHYYMMAAQMSQIQPQIINTQHMSHAVPYTHQNRGLPHQTMPAQYYIPFPNQQAYGQQAWSSNPYVFQTPYHTNHGQPAAQMMAPAHIQAPRGAQVSAPVMSAPLSVSVPGSVNTNNEVNESTQISQKPVLQKRPRKMAVLTDPNSGKDIDIEELASKDVSQNQSAVPPVNESHSGSSKPVNASSTTSLKLNSNEVDPIALQFATQVAVVATEPLTHQNTITDINEIVVSDVNVIKIESEPLVANSNTTLSELSERNNFSDNSESDLTDGNTLVNNTNSTISASISNFNNENDIKLLNNTSAQNLVENISQNSVIVSSGQEIQQNGDTTDSSNQLIAENDEIAKDHSIQKVNNNQRRKDTLKKVDNRILTDELEDNKVNDDSDDSKNINVLEKVESQTTTDPSSSVMLSSLSPESEEPLHNQTICNNISDNDFEKRNAENIRVNDIETIEPSNSNQTTASDLTLPLVKTLPDLPYKEDQWSPINPEGKKHYDRSFLMAVKQKTESSLEMPESLNHVQDIIRKPHQESSGAGPIGDDPFLPGYASKQGSFHRMGVATVNRRQSQPGRPHEKQRKIISTSLTHDVKLHTTDNAWKLSKLTVSQVSDPEEQETVDLLKKIRGILNKLTPQKYDDLVKQIMSLKVDTEDRLRRVLDLVFEKAVDEPAFCLQYANLCKHLAAFKVIVNKGDNSEQVKFQNLLLSKCQKEFETDIYASIENFKERQKEIEECQDSAKKKMLFEILDEDMRRARKRSLGNIKLIGELYKLKMLRANIMVQCIDNLCKEKDDESLECLCALLKTIGEQIETETQKNNVTSILDGFFNTMDKIANSQNPELKTAPRVRFMLRDVIDMRRNGWKARRDENLPKMIDEIHQEVKREDEQRIQDLQQHTLQKKQEREERKMKGGGRQQNDNADQWTTVARKSQSMQQQNQAINWTGMKSLVTQNHDSVQLGPQSSATWSQGSRGGAQSSQSRYQNEDKQNRFSPLESGMNDNRKSQKSNNVSMRDSSRGRSNQQHNYQQSGGGRRPQGKGEREDAINLARNIAFPRQSPSESSPMYPNMMSKNSSRNTSRENSAPSSRNSSLRRETPDIEINTGNELKGPDLSEEGLEQLAKSSIKEYLSLKRMSEPVHDVTKHFNDSNVHIFVSTAINCALEISSQSDQFAIGNLFCHLIVSNYIRTDQFFKGLHSILGLAEDFEIDVPKFWDYIGDVLAPIFVELPSNKRKQFLLDAAKPCRDNNTISILIVKVVKAIAKLTSEIKANELWNSSNLNWEDFLNPNQNAKEFAEENKVEYTIKGPISSPNSEENLQRFSKEVEELIRDKKSNAEIQNFISKYFNATQTLDPRFTSALFSAVIRASIIETTDSSYSYNLDSNVIVEIAPLLGKFFGGDPVVELQALVFLQELMEELQHPSKLLNNIFQLLYDNSVISNDAFLQWLNREDNSPGRGMAVTSTVRFYSWLRENEEEDDENDVTTS